MLKQLQRINPKIAELAERIKQERLDAKLADLPIDEQTRLRAILVAEQAARDLLGIE